MNNLTDKQLEAISKALQQQAEKNAEEEIKRLDRTLDSVVIKLAHDGWTLPAALNIFAVNVIGNTENITDINNFLYNYFIDDNYKVLEETFNNIILSNISDGLKKMTKECWTAFKNKLYGICATSLVSVIEGVLSDFSDDKKNIKMMMVCQKQVDTFPEDGSTIIKHVWSSYNMFIRSLYQPSDFNAEEPEVINRHWLLHGRSDFEIEEIDCVRLFNAIESLCMIVNKKDD